MYLQYSPSSTKNSASSSYREPPQPKPMMFHRGCSIAVPIIPIAKLKARTKPKGIRIDSKPKNLKYTSSAFWTETIAINTTKMDYVTCVDLNSSRYIIIWHFKIRHTYGKDYVMYNEVRTGRIIKPLFFTSKECKFITFLTLQGHHINY